MKNYIDLSWYILIVSKSLKLIVKEDTQTISSQLFWVVCLNVFTSTTWYMSYLHVWGASSTRETTNVIIARDDVRDCARYDERDYARYDERDHCTSSPRETTYVTTTRGDERDHRTRFTTRDDEHDHRERRPTWLPRETTNVIIVFIVFIVNLECESVLKQKVTHHKPKEPCEDSLEIPYSA